MLQAVWPSTTSTNGTIPNKKSPQINKIPFLFVGKGGNKRDFIVRFKAEFKTRKKMGK